MKNRPPVGRNKGWHKLIQYHKDNILACMKCKTTILLHHRKLEVWPTVTRSVELWNVKDIIYFNEWNLNIKGKTRMSKIILSLVYLIIYFFITFSNKFFNEPIFSRIVLWQQGTLKHKKKVIKLSLLTNRKVKYLLQTPKLQAQYTHLPKLMHGYVL